MLSPGKPKYEVLEPGGTFKSKGYREWVQDWSNWFYQPHPDRNNNGDVVFLRSVAFHDGVYSKGPNLMIGDDSLVISENQRVLVPIITANSVSYNTERPEIMYEFVRSHICNGDDPPLARQLKIDGKPIESNYISEDFGPYEIETSIFQIAIPDDAEGPSLKDHGEYMVHSAGLFPAVTRGYFVLLQFTPDKDQQEYFIHCSSSGARTERGLYDATLCYRIIVNKDVQTGISKNIPKGLSQGERPDRNVQILVDTKYAKKELGDGEYDDIMSKLGIPPNDRRFPKAGGADTNSMPDQSDQ